MKSGIGSRAVAVPLALLALVGGACDKKNDAASATVGSGDAPNAKPPSSASSAATTKRNRPAWLTGLTPDEVTVDKALPASELKATLAQWVDKEVTVTGYATFSRGAEDDLHYGVDIAAGPEAPYDKRLLRCSLGSANTIKHVDNKTALTLKGKVNGVMDKSMLVSDCVITQGAPAADAAAITVEQLVAPYIGWYGKEVTLSGLGNGATSSSSKIKGVETVTDLRLDIDMVDDGGRYVNQAGCHLPPPKLDPGISELTKRLGPAFTVRGTIKSIDRGRPQLDPCVVVSK